MAIPTLAPNSTWFTQGGTTVTKESITEINIVDRYTPTGNESASWDASAAKDGGVMCYVNGTVLAIAGNGSGKILANADSADVFKGFTKMAVFTGASVLDTSNVTTLYRAFFDCSELVFLDLNSWNTKNVKNFKNTFNGLLSATTLNVSCWDTSNATDMAGTFSCSPSLTELDLSNWTTGKVTTMRQMFAGSSSYGGAMHLTKIVGIDTWDISEVTDMSAMFQLCSYLQHLDISKWRNSKITIMTSMFFRCESLQELDVSGLDVSNATNMNSVFQFCQNIRNLNLSTWNNTACVAIQNAFSGMIRLEKITLGENFSFNGNGSSAAAVLPTPDPAYISGADGNWYDRDKNAYAPSAIPNKTARTYYASLDVLDAEGEISRGALYLLYRIFSPDVFHAMTGKRHWLD